MKFDGVDDWRNYTSGAWWATSSATTNALTIIPAIPAVAPVAKSRTPLDWLRDQIDEITAVAVA